MAGFLHVFGDALIIFWVLILLLVFHMKWGRYIFHPERRTYDHVRQCEDCKKRIIDGPPSMRYEDWLCADGRKLYDRYGA